MSRRRDELVPDQPNVVVLESYVSSSEGPTIHIDVQSLARLNELEALIQNLASGRLQRVLLSHIADAHWVPPLEEVVLTVSERDSNVSNENRGERLVCKWTNGQNQPKAGWSRLRKSLPWPWWRPASLVINISQGGTPIL
jgi:hypothetical protein